MVALRTTEGEPYTQFIYFTIITTQTVSASFVCVGGEIGFFVLPLTFTPITSYSNQRR